MSSFTCSVGADSILVGDIEIRAVAYYYSLLVTPSLSR